LAFALKLDRLCNERKVKEAKSMMAVTMKGVKQYLMYLTL